MSCYELNSKGEILIHTFRITYTDGGGECDTSERRFCDYTEGWNWARQCGRDWEGIDAENDYRVDIDSEFIPNDLWDAEQSGE